MSVKHHLSKAAVPGEQGLFQISFQKGLSFSQVCTEVTWPYNLLVSPHYNQYLKTTCDPTLITYEPQIWTDLASLFNLQVQTKGKLELLGVYSLTNILRSL